MTLILYSTILSNIVLYSIKIQKYSPREGRERMEKLRRGGFLIGKIHQLAGRILNKKLKKQKVAEINQAQGRLLFILWQHDNIAIQELAERAALSKSTLTSMLDRMEEAGFLIRVPNQEDRRKILIQLTPKADQVNALYTELIQEMATLFYDGFTEAEIDDCEMYLERIFSNLLKIQ